MCDFFQATWCRTDGRKKTHKFKAEAFYLQLVYEFIIKYAVENSFFCQVSLGADMRRNAAHEEMDPKVEWRIILDGSMLSVYYYSSLWTVLHSWSHFAWPVFLGILLMKFLSMANISNQCNTIYSYPSSTLYEFFLMLKSMNCKAFDLLIVS